MRLRQRRRPAADQRHDRGDQEQDHRHDEDDPRDVDRKGRDAAKAQHCGNQRHDKEGNRPTEHDALLRIARRTAPLSVSQPVRHNLVPGVELDQRNSSACLALAAATPRTMREKAMSPAAISHKGSTGSHAAKNGKSGPAAKRNNSAHNGTPADCGSLAVSLSKRRNKTPSWFTMFAQKTAYL